MNTLEKLNLLYVEDEETIYTTMIQVATNFFKGISHCENGEEGLKEFISGKGKYDLIITDIRMPIMNGLDMTEKIREISKDIPIYIISGDNKMEDIVEKLKINHYFNKPIDISLLFNKIKEDFNNLNKS